MKKIEDINKMKKLRMPYLNKVFIAGRLVKDSDYKNINENLEVCEFVIASNKWIKTSTGGKKENTLFIPVICWSSMAQRASKYKKGDEILIEGEIRCDSWVTPNNEKRKRIYISPDRLQKLTLDVEE